MTLFDRDRLWQLTNAVNDTHIALQAAMLRWQTDAAMGPVAEDVYILIARCINALVDSIEKLLEAVNQVKQAGPDTPPGVPTP